MVRPACVTVHAVALVLLVERQTTQRHASPGGLPFRRWLRAPTVGTAHRPLDRLTEPLVRDDGVLRPATWDEALERAAAGFACRTVAGASSIGVFSCSKSTNEMNFIAQKLARVAFGTNNIDSCNRT